MHQKQQPWPIRTMHSGHDACGVDPRPGWEDVHGGVRPLRF